ncbi:uncharacterized protein LOC110100971 [Dendrobium catenatum]|uniref:uncharacterized protein LOC110100971 n=1 Tax=Dendrobium catenatum TaxID=906689 RepID=UPI0010A09BD1|nr:uncharacterized protein LOC110100971 [Dendrobium catenatum]
MEHCNLKNKVYEVNSTLARLNDWWKQRSNVKWLVDGDSNSKFFHAYASARRNSNRIIKIKNEYGEVVEEQEQIEDSFLKYFEEVERVLKQVGGNISPGKDGITYSFMKAYWNIIKEDFWNALKHFLSNGILNEDWKKTLIVHIPKVSNPILPSNYRPISLCNSVYKVAARVLLNRLSEVIPKLITREQAAFIRGRSLSDHVLIAQEVFYKFRISKANKGMVSFKIDMEQAYDSISWGALTKVLLYFNFPPKFSSLLMSCVKDPKFALIINGRYSNWIKAKSGLRQGCPLSPTLFILCAQLLSNAFAQSNCGIKINTNGPKISLLLFADDVVIFSEASKNAIKKVKKILVNFYNWTGQRVNNSKSSMLFGKHVDRRKKKIIAKTMNFKTVKEFNYLGIKMTLRRLSYDDFQLIIDKTFKLLNIWGSKILSVAGKITLVKTVLLALPTYYGTHSLLPKKILDDLEKICRDFIWRKAKGNSGIHYVSWEEMCKPVNEGGRGLFSCSAKKKALRSILAWRYFKNKDSLLQEVFAAKYDEKLKMGSNRINYSPSWKLLNEGYNMLKPIVRWRLANGEKVEVFNDTWILDKSINRWPTFVVPHEEEAFYVKELIHNGSWNVPKLVDMFGTKLVSLILQLKIDQGSGKDEMELVQHNSGLTVAGMAFKAINHHNREQNHWNWFKNIKLNALVELFWWKIFKNAIPTFKYLHRRRLRDNAECPRGCTTIEDQEHVLCTCLKLKEVINLLNLWGFCIPKFRNYEDCIKWLEMVARKRGLVASLYCNAVFLSWKSRNKKIHEGMEESSTFIASNAICYTSILNNFNHFSTGNWDVNQSKRLSNSWQPPPPEWLKVNVDASLLTSYKAGLAGVFRDCKGRFLYVFGIKCIHWDIAKLELLAIYSLKEQMKDWMFQYKGIIIEGDNSNIISFIQKTWEKDKQLPLGVYVYGREGRFFQKVEYEKVSSFCYRCGKVGHLSFNYKINNGEDKSSNQNVIAVTNSERQRQEEKKGEIGKQDNYGPWIHVNHKRKMKTKEVHKKFVYVPKTRKAHGRTFIQNEEECKKDVEEDIVA